MVEHYELQKIEFKGVLKTLGDAWVTKSPRALRRALDWLNCVRRLKQCALTNR